MRCRSQSPSGRPQDGGPPNFRLDTISVTWQFFTLFVQLQAVLNAVPNKDSQSFSSISARCMSEGVCGAIYHDGKPKVYRSV